MRTGQESPERQTSETGLLYAAIAGMVGVCLGILLLLLLLIPVFGTTVGVGLFLALAVVIAVACIGRLRRGGNRA